MKRRVTFFRLNPAACGALVAALACTTAQAERVVSLGGPATGYVALFNAKNSTTQNGIEGKDPSGNFNPNHNGLPDYPNFQIPTDPPGTGVFTAVIASPLLAAADYTPISDEFFGGDPIVYNNQNRNQSDAAALSAGEIGYDNQLVPAVGNVTIPVSQLTFDFNTFIWDGVVDAEPRSNFTLPTAPIAISPFSPVYTEFNDGSGAGNAQFFYDITISNVTGSGLTFEDGVLTSMDIAGDINIDAFVAPFAGFGSLNYTGSFTASGLDYAFDVSGTDSLAFFSNLSLLMNRAGTAAVVPEPASCVLLAATVFGLARRR